MCRSCRLSGTSVWSGDCRYRLVADGDRLLAVVGIKLPGLEFKNQQVRPPTVKSWFIVKRCRACDAALTRAV
ncbi:hypothetical protein ACLK1T_05340 [Escherichia coli]